MSLFGRIINIGSTNNKNICYTCCMIFLQIIIVQLPTYFLYENNTNGFNDLYNFSLIFKTSKKICEFTSNCFLWKSILFSAVPFLLFFNSLFFQHFADMLFFNNKLLYRMFSKTFPNLEGVFFFRNNNKYIR